jgi:beta-glucanase (GH16 family)
MRITKNSPIIGFLVLGVLIIALITVFVSQQQTQYRQHAAHMTTMPVGQTGRWTLIFDDEFDGTSLDTTKWTTCYPEGCDHRELNLYVPDDVIVSNGTLKLRAEKRSVGGKNYVSGMIQSGPSHLAPNTSKFSFTYGYMEMRAKVPKGKGMWPGFWTLPIDLSWPPEIDVLEILGDSTNIIHLTYHYPTASDGDSARGRKWTGPDFSANWHTYAVDWEPNVIIWYVDGIERLRYTDTTRIVKKPMYLIANLAVGGDSPGAPDASTSFPSYYEIDYIRVWKRAITGG